MEEGQPPDVRDSLNELEQRLLELERELRADATSDAGIARQRIPVPRPPHPSARPPEREREPVGVGAGSGTEGDPPHGPAAEPPGAASPHGGAPPPGAAPPPAGAPPPGPPPGPPGTPPPAGVPRVVYQAPVTPPAPEIGPLVAETQRRVDSLRDTLDGLTGASDRLREVAQVVVEDHGRALVRLERATAQQYARAPAAYPPAAPVRARPAGEVAEDFERPAAQQGAPLPEDLERAPAQPAEDFERPLQPGEAVTEDFERPAEAEPLREEARRRAAPRWLWWVLAPLLIAAGIATAVVLFGDDDGVAPPASVPGSSSRIALDADLGPDAEAFDAVPGTRPASDIGPEADLCDGVVGAAVVLRTSADASLPRCQGLITLADGTVSARALAEPRGGGERPCVNADQVSSVASSRRNPRLNVARQRAIRRAVDSARSQTRTAGLTPAERVGALSSAAYEAGRRFDAQRRLRLLAVRERAGSACVVPGRDDVASGRYPLATRIELLTRAGNARQPVVQRAAVAIDNLTSGPAPIDATVLRRAR